MEPSFFTFQGSGIYFVIAAISASFANFIIAMTTTELVGN
ncbi:hypothetical protein AVDCRST_MAG92-668 [uncultured Coleofasciculus sp.]|jgi:hypothetical protein|uniref:Uncharacterized protein n=1 Tax=uncultured Coleofasciculus sp. TaxID=1267456 RepID=A0A6J4HFF0_9CYAN|nr:hypothetical protein AVDCRST_MAG92-668 [uncultured Coleofasciculus sp.]